MGQGECIDMFSDKKSMQDFGSDFVSMLPEHLSRLRIPGRAISNGVRRDPVAAKIENPTGIQNAVRSVLFERTTQEAHCFAETAFNAFLKKAEIDEGVFRFFNGWNETHKTTSLVSAKIIMRLSADAVSIDQDEHCGHGVVLAHMHEVAKDDFGLGHEGHDGMYDYMTAAFGTSNWVDKHYAVKECGDFSSFLYHVGVADCKAPLKSEAYQKSIMNAMMVSIASELWNGREYNFLSQYIEKKLLAVNAALKSDLTGLRNAKAYVMGHSGEVENRHGLHALAAAQEFGRVSGLPFELCRLQEVMMDYNRRVGIAFRSLCNVLM